MTVHFHVTEMPAVTTRPSVTALDRSTMHPKFDPKGVQTHDLLAPDHDSTFHVTETPAVHRHSVFFKRKRSVIH